MISNYLDIFSKRIDFCDKDISLRDAIYYGIRGAIIDGDFPMGERIVEKRFAKLLNISRTPVREALRKLEEEGLVKRIPNMGVVVKRINKDNIIEIFKMREVLENIAISEGVKLMSDRDYEQLDRILQMTRIAYESGDLDEVFLLFSTFNRKLIEFSRMPRIIDAIGRLESYTLIIKKMTFTNRFRIETAMNEHERILELMKLKDNENLEVIHKKHLKKSLDNVLEYYESFRQNRN